MEIEEIKRAIEDHEARIRKLEGINPLKQVNKKEKSLREFVNEHKNESDVDKTILILFFKEKFIGIEGITSRDVTEGFREIREKAPGNIADKFQQLAKRGLITSSKLSKKLNSWTYTNSGEEYIASIKK